jgi:hypothetical protein
MPRFTNPLLGEADTVGVLVDAATICVKGGPLIGWVSINNVYKLI